MCPSYPHCISTPHQYCRISFSFQFSKSLPLFSSPARFSCSLPLACLPSFSQVYVLWQVVQSPEVSGKNGAWPQVHSLLLSRMLFINLQPGSAFLSRSESADFENQTTSQRLSEQEWAQKRSSSSDTERNGFALLVQSCTAALKLLICSTVLWRELHDWPQSRRIDLNYCSEWSPWLSPMCCNLSCTEAVRIMERRINTEGYFWMLRSCRLECMCRLKR